MTETEERQFVAAVRPCMLNGRAGDWEHACRVVRWVKVLGKDRPDLDLLITAAYVHDIGWSGIAPKGKIDFDEMLRLEPAAAGNSNPMINSVLGKLGYAAADIATVQRLVAAADNHQSEQDDEAVLVDADNLSKLCLEHIQEKYQPESYAKLVTQWESELASRISTPHGKAVFPKLLEEVKRQLRLSGT